MLRGLGAPEGATATPRGVLFAKYATFKNIPIFLPILKALEKSLNFH